MKKGQINVQTENIFPIIKKFLYSDHEIFLRELVSNAVDATQKLRVLSSSGEFKGELGDLKVEVILDKDARTLTIRDNGVGMTADEIDKYINQIAFSGAEEFVQQYKGKEGAEQIIGHFGLGFYSAFMVAERVQIQTLSRHEGSQSVQWESNGNPEFTIEEIEKKDRGTDIVLYIAEDSLEFLEESRIRGILDKYCKFLPIPVVFGKETIKQDDPSGEKDEEGNPKKIDVEQERQINNTAPAWTKSPSELTDEDYKSFYHELYPMTFEEPLFHIHLNVDYPFNLTGILFFPKIKENVEVQRNKIQLYSNQVFITDSVENIVPDFLTLLHGVIDSPDIPLNVSRSYLQADSNVKKISAHITKKVADKLREMFNKDRKDFESKWNDLKVFVEYGILSEDKFAEKAEKFVLLNSTEGGFYTVEEYKEKIKASQTDKNDKVVILYTNDKDGQYSFVKSAKERGYDVLEMNSPLTPHFISKLEQTDTDISFARVDSDSLDRLIQKEEELPSKLTKEQEEAIKPVFEEAVDKVKFTVQFQSMSEKDAPIIITQPEFIRRMMEQQKLGGAGFMGAFPESYNLVVNSNHPKISSLVEVEDEAVKKNTVKQLADLALLSQGMLKGEALDKFIERSIELV
ncbi:molecular chaperone HtpG [Wandonia haliotis]|uniref:Molecular chaperone HtpG n=1 Tax=Wandonia haliotis TaxID=574963 RepID=A0ABP3Y2E4_9FLAO